MDDRPKGASIVAKSLIRVLKSCWYCGRSVIRVWTDRAVSPMNPRIMRHATRVMTRVAERSESPFFFSQNNPGVASMVMMIAIRKSEIIYAVVFAAIMMMNMSAITRSERSTCDISVETKVNSSSVPDSKKSVIGI